MGSNATVTEQDRAAEAVARFICEEVGVEYPSGLVDIQARELLDALRADGFRVVYSPCGGSCRGECEETS